LKTCLEGKARDEVLLKVLDEGSEEDCIFEK